jgi:hypothetical protein
VVKLARGKERKKKKKKKSVEFNTTKTVKVFYSHTLNKSIHFIYTHNKYYTVPSGIV